jgi:gamma-glutamyltranspeptidase/glutathione hydrolase
MAQTQRPVVRGTRWAVSSTHHLATQAGTRMLELGGNAIDAGVATGLCINVLEPQLANFGGVAPIVIWLARERRPVVISGLGRWPRRASIQYFQEHCDGDMPEGILRSVTPAAPDAWLTALARYGRLTLAQVMGPARELADRGFPMYASLRNAIEQSVEQLSRWPSNAELFLPGGRVPELGEVFRQRDLAASLDRLIETEAANRQRGRAAAIRAARDEFYLGAMAQRMGEFAQDEGGLIDAQDLAAFSVGVEAPVTMTYKGIDVYACGPWSQGMLVPQTLNLLEGYDLKAMGHNSAAYLHTLVEALKLSIGDRERYYGDPDFVDVPIRGLLSAGYAETQRARLDPSRAHPAMPAPGDPWAFEGRRPRELAYSGAPAPLPLERQFDTSYCCAVDDEGNGFSATPSDPGFQSPTVPGLGFIISCRGTQSWLDPAHTSRLEPGKRPRLTPNPAIAVKNGRLYMTFGCPGGDGQSQAMVQTFLNVVEFGMDPQAAIEAPRAMSQSFPNSFWPHAYYPNLLNVEARVPAEVRGRLAELGHDMEEWPEWSRAACSMCAIEVDAERGVLAAGADVRRPACYAAAW